MRIQIFHTRPVIGLAYFFAISAFAMTVDGQQPDRGFRSANTYAASGLDAVNMANGNLILNIPIASLPTGRGGSPGYSVSLQYNSKIWESHEGIEDHGIPDEHGVTRYAVSRLALSDSGGWRLASGYNIRVTDRLYFETPDPCSMGDPVEHLMFRWKVELETPDGSIRPLFPRISNGANPIMSADGYAAVDTSGKYYHAVQTTNPSTGACMIVDNSYQLTTGGMTYITLDGSQIRVFMPYQSQNWKVFFKDGGVVENAPPDTPEVSQRITDRNGNAVEHRGNQICDQVGRCITFHTNESYETVISVIGVGGETVSTRITWSGRWIQSTYRVTNAQNAPEFMVYETVRVNAPVVEKIVFPSQLGQQEMQFEYFGSQTPPDPGVGTEGWGELKTATLPTGARAHFQYEENGNTAASILQRAVVDKRLEYQEQYAGESPTSRTDVWKYNTSNWGGDVRSPSGAFSSEGKHHDMYLGLWSNGLAFENNNPENLVERIWAHNIPFTISGSGPYPPGIFVGAGSANAYVKTEFTTPRSINGSVSESSPTAIKDYKYDKNGNVLEIAEYDWVPHGSIPRSAGIPSGLPSTGLTLKRKTVNTYYNQAADAGTATANANSYSDPSSPKLKNLIKSTEIREGDGRPVSRTEFFYDDPNNRGNLIETRSWDSNKGLHTNPLSLANSISTRAEYDQYGNIVKSIDARGVETVISFGDIAGPNGAVGGLYPTQTVTASNHANLSRISSAAYDFFTGLVTTTVDVDNNVATVMEYDALGRSVKIRNAAGTPGESWTRTEYDDANRRVVVRSDVDAVGDGRKIATQFFDQLGRLRLTKTLEDPGQSATNESDGIKIETRYGYHDPTPSNPNDPENSLGSYTLTSNPFRAPTSTSAALEQTIGWTRSFSTPTGLRQENETFSGAELPAPWGNNLASTGMVITESDANGSTTTDQAGKKRRSISDGLGQLIRVDEPNGTGDLGTANAPHQPTNYSYSASGKLVRVQQGIQNRYFMYDSLGRLLRIRQPEQELNPALSTSGNAGNNEWTAGFTYDNNANLTGSVDANNVSISSVYDPLNRPISRSYSDATPPVSFTYDTPAVSYSKGRLTLVASSVSISRILAFDAVGRVTESQQTTDGLIFPSSHKYNLAGTLVEQTYPSGRVVTNFIDADGELASIASRAANAPYRNYATNFSYSSSGAIKQLQLGNGLWETARFNSRMQVTELGIGTTSTASSLWRLEYQYGELDASGNLDTTRNAGNVARQTISSSSLASQFIQSYKYDSLDRITDARETFSGSQTWRQTFGYDRYGNRTSFSQSVVGQQIPINSLTLPEVDPMTNRFREPQGYGYDAVGNLTQDPTGRAFVFNGENKQVEVRDAQGSVIGRYAYDGNGKRIKKITGSETTVFVYDGLGKLIAELSTAAQPPDPTVNYTATDTLGSPRVMTNKQGQIIARRDFMPFGEDLPTDANYRTLSLKYGAANSVRQKFTGYERDTETGLDFAEARYYNQSHGRFTAVDPLLASGRSANPQTFNRYTYAMNRPTVLTDSSGMCPDDDITTDPCEVTPTVAPQAVEIYGSIVDDNGRVLEPSVVAFLPPELVRELTQAGELAEQLGVAFDRDRQAALEYGAAAVNQMDGLEWGSEIRTLGLSAVGFPFNVPVTAPYVDDAFSNTDPNELSHTYVDGRYMLNLPGSVVSGGGVNVSALGLGAGVSLPGATHTLNNVVVELQNNSNDLQTKFTQHTSDDASRVFARANDRTAVSYQAIRPDGSRDSQVQQVQLRQYVLYRLHRDRILAGTAAAQRRGGR